MPEKPQHASPPSQAVGPRRAGYYPVTLTTERGAVDGRYYPVPGASSAVVYVGGAGGGWDTPAQGLYPLLCENLQGLGIAGLRVRFRNPLLLGEAVFDVLAGLRYLQDNGIGSVALVGHSFGGAVAIQAATAWPNVRTVVTLATQSYGGEPIVNLPPGTAILLMHGNEDAVLPARCSEFLYKLAREPKRIVHLEGTGHVLDEAAEHVYQTVHDWLLEQLTPGKG